MTETCSLVYLSFCLLLVHLPVNMQVKDGPAEGRVASRELSTTDITHHRPDLLVRQHSLPASLQRSSSGVDSYRVYRGLVTGASQGNNACTYQKGLFCNLVSLSSTLACTSEKDMPLTSLIRRLHPSLVNKEADD